MRRAFWNLIAVFLFTSLGHLNAGQNPHVKSEKQQLKERQQAARKLLSRQEINTNRALKQARIPGSQRSQVRHQMKREKHQLRDRQRDEMQSLKDRRNIIKERSGRS